MRILHVINSLSGSGGAEHGLVREIERFRSETEQVVVTLFDGGALAERLDRAGIRLRSLGLESSGSGWNWTIGARRLRSVIEEEESEVVHTTLASGNLVGQLASRGRRVPVLSTFTLSGDPRLMRIYQPGAHKVKAAVFRQIAALAGRREDVHFRALTSDAARTNVEAMGISPHRVTVIPRGVPLPSSGVPDRESLGLPPDLPVLLNVGRQTAQKGHSDLIDAFARVVERRNAFLVILGREGDGTPDLESAIRRRRLQERVLVIPYTDRPYDYYRSADLFVFTSHMEGLGTALLEAMVCGLPVLAYDIPPVREIAVGGEFATLSPRGDTGTLAENISAHLDRPGDVSDMTVAAAAHAQAKYSLDAIAKRVEGLLDHVADTGR